MGGGGWGDILGGCRRRRWVPKKYLKIQKILIFRGWTKVVEELGVQAPREYVYGPSGTDLGAPWGPRGPKVEVF